mmetsp:Transcript_3019/g.13602  ORF Transcript_3019/g.13602 Transcript_3019/m.13602 type:complete len:240 (-) Transcript_3019:750-1469(-)
MTRNTSRWRRAAASRTTYRRCFRLCKRRRRIRRCFTTCWRRCPRSSARWSRRPWLTSDLINALNALMLIVDILDYDEPASLALGFPNDITGPLLRSVPLLHPPRLPPAVFNPRLDDPEPLQLAPEPPREPTAPAPPPRPRSRGPREAKRRGDERDENQNFRRQIHEGIRGFVRCVVFPALDPHLLHALELLEPLTRGDVMVRGEQVLEQGSGDGGVRRVAGFGSFSFSFGTRQIAPALY